MAGYLPILFYLFLMCLILLTIFKDRRIGIFYFLPFLPLTVLFIKMQKYPLGKDMVDVMLLAIIAGWFFQNRKFIKTELNKPIFIFMLFTFFELLNGYMYLGEGLNLGDVRTQWWKNYMIMPVILFIVVNNIEKIGEIKKLVFLMSFVYLWIGLKFFLSYEDSGYFSSSFKRDAGVFVYFSSNYMAAFMVQYITIFLSLFYYYKQNIWYRIYYLAPVIFGIYHILFLFSRGAYFAFMVVASLIGVFKDRRILVGIIFFLMFWNMIVPTSVFQRINMSMNADDGMGGESVTRGTMWRHAYEVFKDNPVFGTGYRTYLYTLTDELRQEFQENVGMQIKDTHSIYFNVLAEMGIVGLSLLLYLFFLAGRSGWRLFRLAEDGFLKGLGLGFFLSVISCSITNAFGDHWNPYSIQGYFWILWALVDRGLSIVRNQSLTDKRGVFLGGN